MGISPNELLSIVPGIFFSQANLITFMPHIKTSTPRTFTPHTPYIHINTPHFPPQPPHALSTQYSIAQHPSTAPQHPQSTPPDTPETSPTKPPKRARQAVAHHTATNKSSQTPLHSPLSPNPSLPLQNPPGTITPKPAQSPAWPASPPTLNHHPHHRFLYTRDNHSGSRGGRGVVQRQRLGREERNGGLR